jgi:hypothetical protein
MYRVKKFRRVNLKYLQKTLLTTILRYSPEAIRSTDYNAGKYC